MSGPFATYFGNQRTIAIPVTPMRHDLNFMTAAGTTTVATIVLTAANLAAGTVNLYAYYFSLTPQITAAASGLNMVFLWQFRNAAHAAVGGVNNIFFASCGTGGAAACSLYNVDYFPSVPAHMSLAIPATATEVSLDITIFAIFGAPSAFATMGWGIDPTNSGPTGDIGGGGLAAQGANNPNAF